MAQAIIATKTVSGAPARTRTMREEAGQTFLAGTPVEIDANNGGVQEWAGDPANTKIAGISGGDGSNLATIGLGAPGAMLPFAGLGTSLVFPNKVPNQANAKIIPVGAPMVDGRAPFYAASDDVVFEGVVVAGQTTLAQHEGFICGLTKAADGYWAVDITKTGVASCVTIQMLHPLDGPKLNGRVLFTINAANAGIIA